MSLPLLVAAAVASLANDPSADTLTRAFTDAPLNLPAVKSRFELSNQLPSIPGLMMDTLGNGWGLAQQTARAKYLQARILWVDCTANIDRYNTEEKIVALMRQAKVAGFNTVVFDIKPISGQVVYNSQIAPRLREWRGRVLPADFDPLAIFVREAKATGLNLQVALNAFSEGHRDFKVGPGYDRKSQQTVLYEPRLLVTSPAGRSFVVNPTFNRSVPDGATLAAFNDRSRLPGPNGSVAVTVSKNGTVVEVLESGVVQNLPREGSALVGTGAAAQWLRENCIPGIRLTFETQAEFVPISERPEQQIPLMMNPADVQVQSYALSIVQEILRNYAVDGIIYDDRLRYAGINADFSRTSQQQFESHVGRRLSWPDDVFRFTFTPSLNRGIQAGPYYDAWMNWRALVLRNFVATVRRNIQLLRPNALFGVYAGSWYGEYQKFANNWASPDVEAGFWFLTPEYAQTGFAPLLDFFIAGCYYPTAGVYQAMAQGTAAGMTIEASGQLANRLVNDQTWTYAGIMLSDFRGNPDGLKDALQAAVGATQGVMVFDLSHEIEPMWDVFRHAFADPRKAPHQERGLLAEVRKKRASVDKAGGRKPPVVISTGAAGTGL